MDAAAAARVSAGRGCQLDAAELVRSAIGIAAVVASVHLLPLLAWVQSPARRFGND